MSELTAPPYRPKVSLLPASWFMAGCSVVACGVFVVGRTTSLPLWLLAAEVLATILGLFLLGSFRYQLHKNPLTYGMLLIALATFTGLDASGWHTEVATQGGWQWVRHHLLSFRGLDDLLHADTMLFILGLTCFVSVIAQTRLLEGLAFALLRRNRGTILPTVIAVTAVVAVASGILDGVSMIGLAIRTLVIILMLAAAPAHAVRYAVMVCTAVTTICGVWLAYGEPPNLIMKANLYPQLGNAFFLMYCAPVAIASYAVVAWHLRRTLRGQRIRLEDMDVIDANAADVRFLQAARHGEVLTPIELIQAHTAPTDTWGERVIARLGGGEPLGVALIQEDVPEPTRRLLLGHFVAEELADGLDRHYVFDVAGQYEMAVQAEQAVDDVLAAMARARRRAQRIGALALVPFVGLLIVHGVHHEVPLFLASFAGFVCALPAISRLPKMRALALRDARQEFAEYYFLFPLFLSISLLTTAGFFAGMHGLIVHGIETLGTAHVALAQFLGSTLLSAVLDNNVVADFASRGLLGLETEMLRLFAMAQISGYALGGCWTHIGSSQAVVAYAFIQRDLDSQYRPAQWIKEMTPILVKILGVMVVIVYIESALLGLLWSNGK